MTTPPTPARFQIRITDIFVLLVVIAIRISVWDAPQESWFIALKIPALVICWLFILFAFPKILNASSWRNWLLVLGVLILYAPVSMLFSWMQSDYEQKAWDLKHRQARNANEIEYFVYGGQHNKFSRVTNIPHVIDIREPPPPCVFESSLKNLPGVPIGIMNAECDDPVNNALKAKPFDGYLIKMLKGVASGESSEGLSYFVDGKMTRGYALIIYPAKYDEQHNYSFLYDQHNSQWAKDLGPNTHQIISKTQLFDPTGWERLR